MNRSFYAQMLKEGTMKKQTIIIAMLTILSFLLVTWLPCQADDVLCGCAKIKKGTLRIIDCSSQCLKSEYAVTLSGDAGGGGQTGKLACVTGAFENETYDPNDIHYRLLLTNQKNIVISDPAEVFTSYVDTTDPDPENMKWGLTCTEDWVNTGCTASSYSVTVYPDVDVPQYFNGCHSDNEEYGNVTIFTTCCKIVN